MNKTITNEMYDALIHYAANLWAVDKVAEVFGVSEEKVEEVLADYDFQHEYENAPTDEDGLTEEGDEIINNLLENVAQEILA